MKKPTTIRSYLIKDGINGKGVFAARDINKNTILFKMHGEIISKPTRTSVQIGNDLHIEDELAGLLNHACQPSAKVDRQQQAIISLRDIKEGEEITFDYTQNEDHMAVPFTCECCGNKISGKKVPA